jgi:hypothetical protein
VIAQTAFGFAAPPAPATLPPRAPRRVPMFFMGTHMPSLEHLDYSCPSCGRRHRHLLVPEEPATIS